jgi:hypothetical protein
MTVMLMSNPGLHLALLGNPLPRRGFPSRKRLTQAQWRAKHRTGRLHKIKGGGRYRISSHSAVKHRGKRHHVKGIAWSGRLGGVAYRGSLKRSGSRSYHKVAWTNPRRRHSRKNPMKIKALSGYMSAVKRAPREILSTFKGPKKIKHIAFAAGGALGTYALGGMVTASVIVPLLNRVGAGSFMGSPTVKRVLGGMVPFTLGFVASKFIRNADLKKAVMVGGAVASLVEIVSPGMIGSLINRVTASAPMLAPAAAALPATAKAGPVNGMAGLSGYVDSPAYQGTGGYVDSPAYQGTGDMTDQMDGYVDSPAYQGTGDDDDLAGPDDAMAGVDGYLTEGQKYMDSYLNGN